MLNLKAGIHEPPYCTISSNGTYKFAEPEPASRELLRQQQPEIAGLIERIEQLEEAAHGKR